VVCYTVPPRVQSALRTFGVTEASWWWHVSCGDIGAMIRASALPIMTRRCCRACIASSLLGFAFGITPALASAERMGVLY